VDIFAVVNVSMTASFLSGTKSFSGRIAHQSLQGEWLALGAMAHMIRHLKELGAV